MQKKLDNNNLEVSTIEVWKSIYDLRFQFNTGKITCSYYIWSQLFQFVVNWYHNYMVPGDNSQRGHFSKVTLHEKKNS